MEERRLGPVVGVGTWNTFKGDVQLANRIVGAALAARLEDGERDLDDGEEIEVVRLTAPELEAALPRFRTRRRSRRSCWSSASASNVSRTWAKDRPTTHPPPNRRVG